MGLKGQFYRRVGLKAQFYRRVGGPERPVLQKGGPERPVLQKAGPESAGLQKIAVPAKDKSIAVTICLKVGMCAMQEGLQWTESNQGR